jgi:outer membrane lipoprotein SlyB
LVVAALGPAGCARAPAPAVPAASAATNDVVSGTLIAIRPVRASAPILAALGDAGAGGGESPGSHTAEFILRDETGRTISVVQGDTGAFSPGQRVVIQRVPRARIEPLR